MEIKDMDNNVLFRHYELAKRELKLKQSEVKQYEKEISERFDDGRLSDK